MGSRPPITLQTPDKNNYVPSLEFINCIWKHYKNDDLYITTRYMFNATSDKWNIVYQKYPITLDRNQYSVHSEEDYAVGYTRSIEDFHSYITHESKVKRRFTFVRHHNNQAHHYDENHPIHPQSFTTTNKSYKPNLENFHQLLKAFKNDTDNTKKDRPQIFKLSGIDVLVEESKFKLGAMSVRLAYPTWDKEKDDAVLQKILEIANKYEQDDIEASQQED